MVGGLLAGIRVVEVAMFAPDATGMHLADLGADVIKVEQPGIGDPARLLGSAVPGRITRDPALEPGQAEHRARSAQRCRGRQDLP